MANLTFNIDIDDEEIVAKVETAAQLSLARAIKVGFQYGQDEARRELGSRFKLWEHGYKHHQVDNNTWVIELDGKLAEMMDDGYNDSQIKEMLLNGFRAKYNKKTGKKYIDVPMDQKESNGSVGGFSVQQFKDADSLMATFKQTTMNANGSKSVNVMREKIKKLGKADNKVIQTNVGSPDSRYIKIKRITQDSKGWDKQHPGIKYLDDGGKIMRKIEESFYKLLEQELR